MKHRMVLHLTVFLMLCLCSKGYAQLAVTTDHTNGIYKVGDTVQWIIRNNEQNAASECTYVLKQGGYREIEKGSLTFGFTHGLTVLKSRIDKPDTLLLEVRGKDSTGKVQRVLGGVVFSPDKIRPSSQRPKDFDAFWKAKIKELSRVPTNPVLETADANKPGVDYWKIKMDNIRGTHIQGQIARPAIADKLPALLIVQWAGVYPLQKSWATDRAAEGWLVLNIEAHDLPIDEPEPFYQQQFAGALKNYWAIGNDDRETSYFLRMYLSCYRAAQYLTERTDWDGQTLVVMGGSQGGLQSLVTAGIHPKITAALAIVPAGCDYLGAEVGRDTGWPKWYWNTQGKDEKRVRETGKYFDVVNFASRIKCPVLVGAGLIDETCPPVGILAAVNQAQGAKEVILLPQGAHQEINRSHAAYNTRCYGDWLPMLRQGKPAPIVSEPKGE